MHAVDRILSREERPTLVDREPSDSGTNAR